MHALYNRLTLMLVGIEHHRSRTCNVVVVVLGFSSVTKALAHHVDCADGVAVLLGDEAAIWKALALKFRCLYGEFRCKTELARMLLPLMEVRISFVL